MSVNVIGCGTVVGVSVHAWVYACMHACMHTVKWYRHPRDRLCAEIPEFINNQKDVLIEESVGFVEDQERQGKSLDLFIYMV